MRSRFVIPAAILVAAAYIKGRQDARPAASAAAPPGPSPESILRARAEAADAWEMGLSGPGAEAPAAWDVALAEAEAAAVAPAEPPPSAVPYEGAPSPAPAWVPRVDAAPGRQPAAARPALSWEPDRLTLSEWSGHPVGAAAPIASAATASGRFTVGGWAVQAGHLALCGITFPRRLAEAVEAGRVRLVPEVLQNVAPGGLVVPADAGFAPDAEGFTLLAAAAGPGPFAASGRYELIAGTAG